MFTSVKKMVSTFESRQQPQPSSVMSSSSSVLTSKHPKRELESSLTRCTSAGHLFAKPCCSAPSSPTLKRAAGFHVSPCSVRLQSPALHSSHPDLQHCPLRSAPSAPHPSPRHPSFPSLHLPTSSEKSRDGAQKKEGWPRSKARDSWPSSHMEVRHGVQRCPKSMYWEHGGSDFSDKEEQWYFTDSSAPMLAGSHGVPRTVGLGVSRGAEFPQSRGGPPLLTSGAPCRTASVSRFKTVPQSLTGPQPRPTGTCQLEKQPGIHITVSRNVLCASAHKPLNLTLPQPPPALQSKLNVGRASPKAYPRDELKQDAFQPIPTEVVTPRPNHTQAQCHLFVPDNAAPIVQTHPHCGSDVDLDSSGSTEVQGYLNSNPNVDGSQTMTKIGLQDLNPLTYLMQPVGGSMAVEKVWTTGAKGIVGAEQLNSAVGQGSIHVSPHWSQGTASTVRCIGSSQNSIPQRPVQNCISSDSQTSNHDGSDVNNAAGTVNQGTQRCSGADMKECQDSLAAEASPHSSITSTPGIATPITVQSPPSALSCSNVLGRSPSGSIADGPVAVATCVVGCRPADVISSSGALSQQNPRYSRLAGQVVPSGQKAPTRNSDKAFLALLLFIHSGSSNSMVAIDNKIEQAMDLVKTHLMMAVREEVEILREQIKELTERNAQLERENYILRALRERD